MKARRTYGEQEAKNPGRWLSRTDAFDSLVGACRTAGGMRGLRDELLIRLGLLGLRLNELHLLTVGSYDRTAAVLRLVGKSHKPAEVHLSPTAIRLLDEWLAAYAAAVPLSDELPLLCPTRPRLPDAVQWGVALGGIGGWAIVLHAPGRGGTALPGGRTRGAAGRRLRAR
ncbi:MAG: hypothetical protein ABIY58_01000 [Acidimicrobiales bacterium]